MSEGELAWAAWAVGSLGSFLALEALALLDEKRPTLSSTLRRWLGIDPRRPWALAGVAVALGAGAWFGVHIAFGVLP